MPDNRNDKNIKAAIPAPRDFRNVVAMTNNSPTKTSFALSASYPSASAHPQLPRRLDDSFQTTELKEQSLHNNIHRSVENSTSITHPSIDKLEQGKPHQHSVAEQGMNNPATAYPRVQEQQVDNCRAQLNTDLWTREQRLEDLLKRTEFDLREKEAQLNNLQIQFKTSHATKDHQSSNFLDEVQTKLAEKDQELKDLTARFRAEIIEKDREVDDIRQLWKKTAKELGKHQAQDKVIDQVTDSELIQKARQIQYNVRNFAYQHFGDELNTGKSVQGSWQYLQKRLKLSPDFFEACINSPLKRPMLVGAILWTFLEDDIFERFCWGGAKVQHGMKTLTDILGKPLESDVLADRPEAERKYQMWKASTSGLLVDALGFEREREQAMSRKLSRDKIKDLCKQLAPLTKSKYEGLAAQVSDIINEALDLDQLFSKQVAEIYWTAVINKSRRFNEAFMELQQGEKRTVDDHVVQLVVAPGLIKRGKSTGEDYEMESVLLRITVSCELITADSPGESHKPALPPRESSKPGAKLREWFTTTKEPKTERAQPFR